MLLRLQVIVRQQCDMRNARIIRLPNITALTVSSLFFISMVGVCVCVCPANSPSISMISNCTGTLQESCVESVQLQLPLGVVLGLAAQARAVGRNATLRGAGARTRRGHPGSAVARVQVLERCGRGVPGRGLLSAVVHMHRHGGAMLTQQAQGDSARHTGRNV